MTDLPIIFSVPMVDAILHGRKTMTRRLAILTAKELANHGQSGSDRASLWTRVVPGDRLWVRETHWRLGHWTSKKAAGKVSYSFQVDVRQPAVFEPRVPMGKFAEPDLAWHQRPSIFMPRSQSRTTLIVNATKIERLQDISEADAIAEGIEFRDGCFGTWNPDGTMRCGGSGSAREAFRCLWINLHGTGAWDRNPEVVAISYRVIKANIDAPEARAT